MSAWFPAAIMRSTGYWLDRFTREFHGEIPSKIHNGSIAQDGAPQWNPGFSKWISTGEVIRTSRPEIPTQEDRLRTTRALRKLRKEAIREFEVIYRIMVTGDSIEQTTRWLNDRADRNNVPLPPGQDVHYRTKDTIALIISGIDKMKEWY